MTYRKAVNQFAAHLAATGGPATIGELTRDHVRGCVIALQEAGARPATVANRFRSIYLDAATAKRLIGRYRLIPSPSGNVTLRVVPTNVRPWLAGPVAPWPAVALDLAEDGDPRSLDVARAALERR